MALTGTNMWYHTTPVPHHTGAFGINPMVGWAQGQKRHHDQKLLLGPGCPEGSTALQSAGASDVTTMTTQSHFAHCLWRDPGCRAKCNLHAATYGCLHRTYVVCCGWPGKLI